MDDVPYLFAETVARLCNSNAFCSLIVSRISLFGKVSRLLWEKSLCVTLHVVYNPAAGTFDYCVTCRRHHGFTVFETPYIYDPADHRFVSFFKVTLLKDKSSLEIVDGDVTWTTATPSDPTFLKLLRAPFFRTDLSLDVKCSELLKLLPDYCTFNYITAYGPFIHSKVLDTIILRSQACGRLESVRCTEFFKKRGMEASIAWISTNKRLRRISYYSIENPESVCSALTQIGVQ